MFSLPDTALQMQTKPDYLSGNLVSLEWLKRLVVIGTGGSGKTTFAYQLAQLMRVKHIELDALYWLSDWIPRPRDEFRMLVEEAVATDQWVLDGNYSSARDIVWSRATALIWLKYPFHVLFCRALNRAKQRVFDNQILYSRNRETCQRAFLRLASIFFWVKIHHRHRRYSRFLQEYQDKHLQIFVFRTPARTDRFLSQVKEAIEVNHACSNGSRTSKVCSQRFTGAGQQC